MAEFFKTKQIEEIKKRRREEDEDPDKMEEEQKKEDSVVKYSPDNKKARHLMFDNSPKLTIDYFRALSTKEPLPIDGHFQLYRSYFSSHIEDDFSFILKEKIKHYTPYINSLGLQKKSYYDQYETMDTQKKAKFDELYFKYCLLIDYVDMVHDITTCFDFMLIILKERDTNYYKLLNNLIMELCGGNYANIKIKKSHEIQRRLLNNYIDDLRSIGFLLPYIEDPVAITEKNAKDMISDIKICARESGRYFENFLDSLNIPKSGFVAVKHNALGAIDGCKGECEIGAEITWEYTVAGIFHLHIKSNRGTSNIRVVLFGVNYDFIIKGEIVLDDIVELLQNERIPFRRAGGVRDNNITPFNGFSSRNPLHCAAVISLKTICDKRLVQRMQTDFKVKPNRIDAITTTDKYVPAGTFLAYLGGQIQYCPSVLLTREDGYDRYDFEKSDNLSYDLTIRYSLYLEYLKYFIKKYPEQFTIPDGFVIEEEDPFMLKAFDFTTLYLQAIQNKISDPQYEFNSFWEYIYLTAISKQGDFWNNKLKDLMKKIIDVNRLLSTPQSDKNELINALLSIPTVIPSISEFIGELEDEEDVIDMLNNEVPMGLLYAAFLSSPKYDQELWNRTFPDSSNWNKIDPLTKSNFITSNKIKIKYTNSNFLPSLYIPQSNLYATNGNITIEGDYVSIYYKNNEKSKVDNFIENYKLNEEDEALIVSDVNKFAASNEIQYKVSIPITAELLINIAFNLKPLLGRQDISVLYRLIRLIGDKLFDRVGSFLGLNEENRELFINFFVNCALYAGANKQYNDIWNKLQPGYNEAQGFEVVGPRGKVRGGNKTIKKNKRISVNHKIRKNNKTHNKKQNRKTRKKAISRKDIGKTK